MGIATLSPLVLSHQLIFPVSVLRVIPGLDPMGEQCFEQCILTVQVENSDL